MCGTRGACHGLLLGLVTLLVLALAACGPAPAGGSAPRGGDRAPQGAETAGQSGRGETLAEIEAAAAREGKVVWYDSLSQEMGDKIIQEFQKDYPMVREAKYVEVPSGQKVARVQQESQAGGPTADVDFGNPATAEKYYKQGFVREIDWQALGVEISPELTPTSYMVAVAAPIYGILYNTTRVSEAEVPRSFDDLLNPKWKGRIGTWARAGGFRNLSATWGDQPVREYVSKFAELQPRLYDSNFTVAQAVGAGEIDLAYTIYHTTLPTIQRGAPVKWVYLDPTPMDVLYGFVLRYGENPNAGKLLLKWLASPKGADVYEEVAGRGNPFIPESKTARTLAAVRPVTNPVDVQIRDADRLNQLEDELGRILAGRR